MSQSLEDYQLALVERALRIRDSDKPPNWYLPETVRFAKDATNFLYLLLKSAIAADVPLMPPQNQTISQSSSIQELRYQCYELAEKLYQAELAQQILVALELVGHIARLVRLESERAQQCAETRGIHPHLGKRS